MQSVKVPITNNNTYGITAAAAGFQVEGANGTRGSVNATAIAARGADDRVRIRVAQGSDLIQAHGLILRLRIGSTTLGSVALPQFGSAMGDAVPRREGPVGKEESSGPGSPPSPP